MVDTYLMIYLVLSRLFELFLSKKNTNRLLKEGAVEHYSFFIINLSFYFTLFLLLFF